MRRITIETAGGNQIDIVSGPDAAVSPYYIYEMDLQKLVTRAKELGVTRGVTPIALKVLLSERLIHKRN